MARKKTVRVRRKRKEPEKYDMRSRDAAWILDCSPDDVIMWAKKGLLKAIKVGRFWRFRRSDILAYKKVSQQRG